MEDMDQRDRERFELLDRVKDRLGLDLDQHAIEWSETPDGAQALLVDGGGIDGGKGAYFANAGDDLHAVGTLAPIVPGHIGCIVIRPDGSRQVARAVPDPLGQQKPD
jgi:hypothetical protein